MAFKTLFLAHAPDADREKHRCFIDTGKYQLSVVIVKNQAEALEVSARLFREISIVIWFWGSGGSGRILAIKIPFNHRQEA